MLYAGELNNEQNILLIPGPMFYKNDADETGDSTDVNVTIALFSHVTPIG